MPNIPVSVGIAPTKTLAKLANHTAKKNATYNGSCVLDSPAAWLPVLANFEVRNIWGIGPQYSKMLQGRGVDTALKFAQLPDTWLRKNMSVVGLRTAQELRGISCIELEPQADPKKGITVSRSFGKRITAYTELREALVSYVSRAGEKLRRETLQAKHMLVFMHTSPHATDNGKDPFYAPQMSFALPHYTKPIHDRMPVMLGHNSWSAWMAKKTKANELLEILTPMPANQMKVIPVSPYVNKVSNHGAECITPISEVRSEK